MKGIGEPMLEDVARVQHQRARRRLLYGQWEEDAIRRIYARLGNVRRQAVGFPDLSANPFRAVCHQAAVLYDREPRISHPDDGKDRGASKFLASKLRQALWASKMQRVQRDCIGLREVLVRADVTEVGGLVLRPVFPDRVDATPDELEPDQPGTIREARPRVFGKNGRAQWTYDEIDPSSRSYVVKAEDGAVVTAAAVGGKASGESYPFEWSDGTAFLPYTMYHATPVGQLWDPWELRELVEATYEACVLWTFWSHCVRDASWPQRWAEGVEVAGTNTEGQPSAPRQSVTTDPATVLMFRRIGGDMGGSPQIGQWQPGADPQVLAEALMIYEQRLAAYAGVSDPDFIRRSGDPRSGYALAISRDGQRAAARKFEPQFRAGDLDLLCKCAALLNRHERTVGFEADEEYVELPESGWVLRYPGLPLTPDEQDAKRRNVLELLDRGLISRARAYAEIHELELEEAEAELEDIPDPRAGAAVSAGENGAGALANGAGVAHG